MNGTCCAISPEMKATIAREAPARSCCTYATPTEKERRQTTQRRSQGARYVNVGEAVAGAQIDAAEQFAAPGLPDNRLIAEGWRYQLSRDRRSMERARAELESSQ
jgi:hypothetical protein